MKQKKDIYHSWCILFRVDPDNKCIECYGSQTRYCNKLSCTQ